MCHHTSHPPGPEYPVTLERLEQRAGFKPAVLRICNPLPWVSRPPLRCFYLHVLYKISCCLSMVPRDRIELPSLLCKSRALPLDERGKYGGGRWI